VRLNVRLKYRITESEFNKHLNIFDFIAEKTDLLSYSVTQKGPNWAILNFYLNCKNDLAVSKVIEVYDI
jgi:hypothetical protein